MNDTFRNYANAFNYTAAGAVSAMRLGNGLWETTQFNSRLQPTMIGLGTGSAVQNRLRLDYAYGEMQSSGAIDPTKNNGNLARQMITVPTVMTGGTTHAGFTAVQSYQYDSLNRLKSAVENVQSLNSSNQPVGSQSLSWRQTYTSDRYGNRNFDEANTTTLLKECMESGNPVVCEAIRPIVNPSVNTANNRLNGYTFDAAGNTTVDAQNRTFIYDAENKQIEVQDDKEDIIGQYRYDGDGKRVKKIVPATGEVTVFVYDASGRSIAEYSTVVESAENAKVAYLTSDHLGSPRINTDRDGNVTSRRDFHPFGEELYAGIGGRTGDAGLKYSSNQDDIRQKFTGYQKDNETNLDFAEARMYANSFGRFTAVDPSQNSVHLPNPQTWNRYIYCFNNPLTLVDRNGKWPIDTHIALTLSTFKGLSKTELSVITAGVLSVDGASDGKPLSTYWPSEAYKHYMTPDGMTSDDAWQAGKDWLKGKLEAAKGAQRDWEASGKDGISPSALFAVGEAAHLYQDMTSPAHGLDKTYSVPTIEVEVGGIKINVPDIAKFRQEQKEHYEQESRDPTPEERSKSQHYARTFFLIAFGSKQFARIAMSDEERSAAQQFCSELKGKDCGGGK